MFNQTLLAESLQWCPTLCNPVDCSPPGSSVHGILQARTLEWVAEHFSRGSSWPRDGAGVPGICLHWQAGSLPLALPCIQLGSGSARIGAKQVQESLPFPRSWGVPFPTLWGSHVSAQPQAPNTGIRTSPLPTASASHRLTSTPRPSFLMLLWSLCPFSMSKQLRGECSTMVTLSTWSLMTPRTKQVSVYKITCVSVAALVPA